MTPPRCAQRTAHPRGPVQPPNPAGPRVSRAPAVVPDQRSSLWKPSLERREVGAIYCSPRGDERGGNTRRPRVTPRTYPADIEHAPRAPRLAGRGGTATAGSTAGDRLAQQGERLRLPTAMPCLGIGPGTAIDAEAGTARIDGFARRRTGTEIATA
jgi:hypothetical protein